MEEGAGEVGLFDPEAAEREAIAVAVVGAAS